MCAKQSKSVEYECCDGFRAVSYYEMISHLVELEQAEDSIFDVYPDLARAQEQERQEWIRKHSILGKE